MLFDLHHFEKESHIVHYQALLFICGSPLFLRLRHAFPQSSRPQPPQAVPHNAGFSPFLSAIFPIVFPSVCHSGELTIGEGWSLRLTTDRRDTQHVSSHRTTASKQHAKISVFVWFGQHSTLLYKVAPALLCKSNMSTYNQQSDPIPETPCVIL